MVSIRSNRTLTKILNKEGLQKTSILKMCSFKFTRDLQIVKKNLEIIMSYHVHLSEWSNSKTLMTINTHEQSRTTEFS